MVCEYLNKDIFKERHHLIAVYEPRLALIELNFLKKAFVRQSQKSEQ